MGWDGHQPGWRTAAIQLVGQGEDVGRGVPVAKPGWVLGRFEAPSTGMRHAHRGVDEDDPAQARDGFSQFGRELMHGHAGRPGNR